MIQREDEKMKKRDIQEYIRKLEEMNIVTKKVDCSNILDKTVAYMSYNSQDIRQDTLFVCKGASFKEEYLAEAIDKGVIFYVSEKQYAVDIPGIIVSDIHIALSELAAMYFGYPGEKLDVIGITGTKGKSTTAYYMKYILEEQAHKVGKKAPAVISSIDTYDGVQNFESHITTPESFDLQQHFRNAVDSEITELVMEVSSQALKYNRVHNAHFHYGVFLNVSEDHISPIEHPDFEDYFKSKLKIFAKTDVAIVNLDMDVKDMVLDVAKRDSKKIITFSKQNQSADVYAYAIQKEGLHTKFRVRTPVLDEEFILTMPGLFNIENALAAIAISCEMGMEYPVIYEGLKKAKSSGRMEVYASKDEKIMAIVDYAHNKLSFEKLFESTKEEYPDRKITIVFGCPGKKALLRRRDLGLIAGQNADYIYLTAEDPGEEPVEKISKDIAQYVALHTTNYELIEDRGEAIHEAVQRAEREAGKTVILITGKGNETRQKIGKEYIPCQTDVEYVTAYLTEYDEK